MSPMLPAHVATRELWDVLSVKDVTGALLVLAVQGVCLVFLGDQIFPTGSHVYPHPLILWELSESLSLNTSAYSLRMCLIRRCLI